MRSLHKCLISYLSLPDDDQEMAKRKEVLVWFFSMSFLLGCVGLFSNSANVLVISLSSYVCLSVNACALLWLFVNRKPSDTFIELVGYGDVVAIILSDLASLGTMVVRRWALAILVVDIMLVCKIRSRSSIIVITALIFWLLLTSTEQATRFGLLDIGDESFNSGHEQRFESTCNCTSLPCRQSVAPAVGNFFIMGMIFLLDFYFTRSFASRLYEEHEKMENVILAAENIAETLSRFDLKKAREALDTSPLPPPLHNAFSSILSNLHVYRPYIPDAVFDELQHSGEHLKEVPAPGLETKKAALVFTDIQGSTATWEACPEGMREGLKVHNNVMRECLSEHNGYEVKTIGDSFMVAFEKALDAVSFSLSVQEGLVKSVWPQELLLLDHCALNDDGPWCGLRVRIGVHFGEVDVQLNTLTGRYDYFGNTVNKAARMEGACVGGAVAVTEEVMEKIGAQNNEAIVIPMGEVRLKGVSGPLHPFILLPNSLSGRVPFIESQLLLGRGDRRLVKLVRRSSTTSSRHSTQEVVLLSKTVASVGLLDMRLPDECNAAETSQLINETLAKVMMCTERSHGVLISVQGSRVAVGWNTSRPCPTHIENSLSFVVTLFRALFSQSLCCIHIGLSNSEVKHGTVGARMQKFVTTLGRCVDVAGSLCSLGVKDDVFCLYGSVAEELCKTEMQFELHAEAAVTGLGLNVYEVKADALSSTCVNNNICAF